MPTTRQIQVLRLISHGLGYKQIATRLNISPSTVKSHMNMLLRRLEATNQAQAVAIAYESGWWAPQTKEEFA